MLEHYSVEKVSGNETPEATSMVHVSAASALQAGELALGVPLSLSGPVNSLRAIVWQLTDGFAAISVKLFECVQLPAVATPSPILEGSADDSAPDRGPAVP